MIRRLEAKHTEAVKVFPPDGGHARAGSYDVTILNLDAALGVELVDAADKVVGEGFPLAHGASWDSTVAGSEEIWVVCASGEVALAVSATFMG